MVSPGRKLSLQKHFHRAEHWVVVNGTALVTRDDETLLVRENESIYLPLGCVHRLENPGRIPLTLIEVQSGAYLGEDDIVRFDDVYNRTSSGLTHRQDPARSGRRSTDMRLGRQMQAVEHQHRSRSRSARRALTFSVGGGSPASCTNASAPANPTIAPSITSGSECTPRASREMPITTAASKANGSTADLRRSSTAARPPPTTVAAATWPLGVWRSAVPKLAEQARNTSFSASIAAKVAKTASSQAAAPRRQPCASNVTPIASTSGRMTA